MLYKNNLIEDEAVSEDINPMESVANMVDVMLVLAVGIMLALIINWNVDINQFAQTVTTSVDTENAIEFTDEELEQMSGEGPGDENELKELGSVYFDDKTGTYYIISDEKN